MAGKPYMKGRIYRQSLKRFEIRQARIDKIQAKLDEDIDKFAERCPPHVLSCDEYHQHGAPRCCSASCWCLH